MAFYHQNLSILSIKASDTENKFIMHAEILGPVVRNLGKSLSSG